MSVRVYTKEFEDLVVRLAEERGIPREAFREAFRRVNSRAEELARAIVDYVASQAGRGPRPALLVGMITIGIGAAVEDALIEDALK